MLNDNGVSKRYVGTVSAAGTADNRAPDWVRETETFKHGIKDGSIVDLTPPAPTTARSRKAVHALGHNPLKDAPPVDEARVDEAPSENDDEGSGEETIRQEEAEATAAEETEPKPLGNQLPTKTPKGFSSQPTATGRRGK